MAGADEIQEAPSSAALSEKRQGWMSHHPVWSSLIAIAIGVFVLSSIGAAISSSSSQGPSVTVPDGSSAPAPVATPGPSVAYKLAVIQSGVSLDQNDPLVGQFQSALDALQPKCRNVEERLADFTVRTHDDMAKSGADESYLSILQHVGDSIPDSASRLDCVDVFAAYDTLRTSG